MEVGGGGGGGGGAISEPDLNKHKRELFHTYSSQEQIIDSVSDSVAHVFPDPPNNTSPSRSGAHAMEDRTVLRSTTVWFPHQTASVV